MTVKGTVALVTGAGAGIGKAAALLLAASGARVVCLGRTAAKLDAVVAEIRAGGGDAFSLPADISDADSMRDAILLIEETYGALHTVFANAGINGTWAPVDELTPEEWDKTMSVNLRGTFLTIKYSLPLLRRQGGSITITSSVNGTRMFSNSGASAYSTTKAGQVAFAKMIALEVAKHRIRVNVICPGAIETEINEKTTIRHIEKAREPVSFPEGEIPLTDGEPGRAEQVAQLVLFLSSDAASHITGTEVWIDGGQSLLQG